MIILSILWIIYSIAEAYEDSKYTVILDHKPTLWPRLIIGVITVVLWFADSVIDLRSFIAFVLILASVFWLVFEIAGNLFRDNYALYIGNTSWLDRRLRNYELPVFWVRCWLILFSYTLYYADKLLQTIHYYGLSNR